MEPFPEMLEGGLTMRKLAVFENVTLDGFFTDRNGGMDWAHAGKPDPEFDAYVRGNAKGEATQVFGRITYEQMAGFWPTPMAAEMMPEVAAGMNRAPKIVFSRTLAKAEWNNTRLVKADPVEEIRRLKSEAGSDMVILGSGTIVSQLARAGLVDAYTFVIVPVAIGSGRTLFEGMKEPLGLELVSSRAFPGGKAVLSYAPGKK